MSPPSISQPSSSSSTPTRQPHPFSTARDHFSPGTSQPNPAMSTSRSINLESLIESWLDGLTSPLSTPTERIAVLNQIEKTLVQLTAPGREATLLGLEQRATFWALQATAGLSLAQVLLSHVFRLHQELQRENETSLHQTQSEAQKQRVHHAISEMCISITILQGLTLLSPPSRRITQRKSSLELLLQIVLSDYCTQLLPPLLVSTAALTPTSPNFPSTDAPLSLPSGFALDLLMCVLVDSPQAQERFSDMGGIHQIVQLSHKCADTVTSPVSTPTSGVAPSMAEATRRASEIVALKQTDLLSLEFRYFWGQILQTESKTKIPADASTSTTVEPTTPKASMRKRPSVSNLSNGKDIEGQSETPKQARRRVAAPTSIRATSEEAPSTRPSSRKEGAEAPASASPRKLKHSASTAELRKKPEFKSSMLPPPVPALPASSSTAHLERRQRPSTSQRPSSSGSSRSQLTSQSSEPGVARKERRSTLSEATQQFNPSRPGMSSRDRPRIPSPLKPRSAAQEEAELQLKRKQAESLASQQAIPYRRLRSSTTSTPFSPTEPRHGRSREVDGDAENRDPSSPVEVVGLGAKEARLSSGASETSLPTSRSILGSMGAKIPPSPAVRRAQMARARSLSPTKVSLPRIGVEEVRLASVPQIEF